jgi:hypothetical protein
MNLSHVKRNTASLKRMFLMDKIMQMMVSKQEKPKRGYPSRLSGKVSQTLLSGATSVAQKVGVLGRDGDLVLLKGCSIKPH